MAQRHEVRAVDLLRAGTVHSVVAEDEDDTAEDLAVAVAAECGVWLRQMGRPQRFGELRSAVGA
jgi:acetyl-CoA carboxylase carboxyl transferase subunit beta